ncbi:hypothetical protein IFO70_38500 [Phormidium tenue FACHB-886]|nr:hypothetical protein [Phormidium tenue FACHB-886]
MCWLGIAGGDTEKMLHLRLNPHQPWRPYIAHPHLSVPDYPIPGGTKGWATYQKLMQAGWALVPTAQAQTSSISPSLAA